MVEAINTALREAMAEDDRVVVFGQDVARQGGVFRVTEGLAERFGPRRCFDTPLAESAIVGVALGMALRGMRPVPEIQFDGFTYPAFDQIVSHLAKYRNRTRGALEVPVTIRVPSFGGIGAAEHHSESTEAYWAHTPGLRVVAPGTSADAHDLLRQAIECDDPVLFLEPKRRYWETGDPAGSQGAVDLGRAVVRRGGADVTVVSYGGTVGVALEAAEVAKREHDWELEVLDLRSLAPLDFPTIAASVSRTGRCVVLHEGPRTLGLGAEIAARVQEELFWDLQAPVLRVTGFDTPYPPARWEKAWLPHVDRLLDSIDRSFGYAHD
ncbi:alpha-ketoacid dehydrogenase subunit beta [Streptomyces sp. MZ04]|nr:alpha-ketoacid dehydrogenase subunit beta [Streptomyces sp. MZ04]TGB14840.1 alpha-ketoacid dehydrogenase subunit beta [Streptomyces sp. MZ04]